MEGPDFIPVTMLMRDSGQRFDLQLNPETTIAEVRLRASDYFMKQICLLNANRRILRDDERVGESSITPGCVIFVNPQAMTSSVPLNSRAELVSSAPVRRPTPVLPPRAIGWTKEAVDARTLALVQLGFPRCDC